MKNKFFLSLFALVSLLSGCGKDPGPAGQAFRAVVESFEPAEGPTKTALVEKDDASGYSVTWTVGDQIRINDCLYRADKVSGGTASFVPETAGASSQTFKACYPYLISGWKDGTMSIVLPSEQTEPDSGLVSGFPMYAESSNNSLNFCNLCGLLKLGLKAASGSFTVKSIELKSNNLSLSGECSVVSVGTGIWMASPAAGSGTPAGLKYSCNRLVGNESAAYFYIYLPPGDCTGFDITINTDAGIVHKVANKTISIQRSKVTTISFLSLDPHYAGHEYVDFELPSGTKWATMNVGATSAYDRGTNAAWSDAQDVRWGGAWRVPTKADLEELIANTYWQWTESYKNSGIAGYVVFATYADADKGMITGVYSPSHVYELNTDAHIFLPGTSVDHLQGSYWTSSEVAGEPSKAYRIRFTESAPYRYDVFSGEKTLTLYVRPVCD